MTKGFLLESLVIPSHNARRNSHTSFNNDVDRGKIERYLCLLQIKEN